MGRSLTGSLTAHDLLKTFAVIIMIADHIGFYFFPDDLWWRSVGRIGFPIWFYLIGHASGRDLSPRLIGGALVLLVMNAVVGLALLPMNALVTIILLRVMIDPVMRPVLRSPVYLWSSLLIMAFLILPTSFAVEYGTQALMFAMLGYMVRHRDRLPFGPKIVQAYMIAIAFIFLAYQWISYGFSAAQFIFMAVGTFMVCLVLLDFRAAEFPRLSDKLPEFLKAPIRFCGHRTLEVYVVHLVLFKIVALALGMDGYALFDIHLFNESV